jgi:type IV secretory pathway TrbF-like protein
MAALPKNTPIYSDTLTAWHNQRLWWLLCGAGGVIAALAITLCVVMLRPHSMPWVVEVDGKGEPMGSIAPLVSSEELLDSTTRWSIGQFIEDAFRVSPQFPDEQMLLAKVYAMATGQASDALTAFYHADGGVNNPLNANGKYWQGVRVVRTLKLPTKDSYQVDYTIFKFDRHDHQVDPVTTNWRSTMHLVHGRPTNNNALGLFIDSIDFQPEAK